MRHPVLQSYEYDRARLAYVKLVQRRRRGEPYDLTEARRLEARIGALAAAGYAQLTHAGEHNPRPGGPK